MHGLSQPGPSRPRVQPRRVPHGFLAPPRPKRKPVSEMLEGELRDLHARNARILAQPGPSASNFVQRIAAEQAAIESRLVDVVGVAAIRDGLARTRIDADEQMSVDQDPTPISAKQRALAHYDQQSRLANNHNGSGFTIEDAIRIEQEAHAAERQRQQQRFERKRRLGLPVEGEVLTRVEKDARMWAFLNSKPTESDLEDEEDDDEDDEDPSSWFEPDPDEDGLKGQNIVDPDGDPEEADLSHLIRIDERVLRAVYPASDIPM